MPLSTGLSSPDTMALFDKYVIGNYHRHPVNLVRGEGSRVWDAEGRGYLDFFPGWGCNLLGHCPPDVVAAVQDQVARLIHVPNTWCIDLQARWAQMLSERSFGGKAFFCNSGAEANEAAIKLARLHGGPQRYKMITFHRGFHGRTFGAVTATAQPKYHEGLGPLLAGFTYVPYGDLQAVSDAIDEETCAILVEPVQGEGGIVLPPEGFLSGLRQLADTHELLLMFDEVQTGCGRTGKWFAYQHFSVVPDVITLAKALCGGLAGGAMLCREDLAPSLRPGMHAATFGGNPIAARAGIATLETIERERLLERGFRIGELFRERLLNLARDLDMIREVRVLGTMIGVELEIEGGPIVRACLEKGLLINCTQHNVLRFLPALVLTDQEAEEGFEILEAAMREAVVCT
ncbi:MAG TPA: aspartate aminotransferase family protein [Pirellulaceae bacterium]